MPESFPTASPPQGAASSASPSTVGERKAHKEQPRIRRRNRLITSCLECRRRKLKCDKQQPCTNCTKFARPCVFIAQGLDPEAQAKLAEVKEKMGMLERTLEEDVARRGTPKRSSSTSSPYEAPALPGQEPGYSDEEEDEDAKNLQSTSLAVEDATYYEDDGNDDIVDLGISMGKLRITERIGGLFRPRLSEELNVALKHIPESTAPSSHTGQSPDAWMSPGSDYVAPSSSFFFAPGVEKTSIMTYLPSKVLVDKLLAHYWQAVHPIARTVHRPSFERQHEMFWKQIAAGIEPRTSYQAVFFAALLSSVISMPEEKVLAEFAVDKKSLVDSFQRGTESALARANFLRTTKLETLQAFVMYLLPLCRAEVSRAHSALTGTCIRLAECMGLHRDPTSYSTNPIEIQIRRLIWYQICFLDIRTCEATGPRPQIRRDEYDTRYPLNVNDTELDQAVEKGVRITEDSKHFTDMTITRMRFECVEMFRLIWTERPKLSKKVTKGERKPTLTSLLSRIQAFKAAMANTYFPMMDKSNPLHVMAMEIYGILSTRLYIMVLHPFASHEGRKMPERLRQIMLSSCIIILEHSMNMETQPALSQWSWYVGALHQHHTALLLLSEMYVTPPDPVLSARIWGCLDYTFELPAQLDPSEKSRMILRELVDKTELYASMRRVRPPTNMPHPAPPELAINAVSPQTMSPPQLQVDLHEDRQRSASIQSSDSSHRAGSIQHSQRQQLPRQVPQQAQYNPGSLPITGPLGAMPQVDWGSFDMNTTSSPPPPMVSTSGNTFGLGNLNQQNFGLPVSTPDLLSSINSIPGGDSSTTPGLASTGGSTGSGASPMEAAINEIDWNEWDRLFGNAQMEAGNILIPPFTFPSMEPTDLHWPGQDAGGL